ARQCADRCNVTPGPTAEYSDQAARHAPTRAGQPIRVLLLGPLDSSPSRARVAPGRVAYPTLIVEPDVATGTRLPSSFLPGYGFLDDLFKVRLGNAGYLCL